MTPRLKDMIVRNPNIDAGKAKQYMEISKRISQMEVSASKRASYTVAHPFERTPKRPAR
jgi:hypothetical protein